MFHVFYISFALFFVMDFNVFESSAAAVLTPALGLQMKIWQDVKKRNVINVQCPCNSKPAWMKTQLGGCKFARSKVALEYT